MNKPNRTGLRSAAYLILEKDNRILLLRRYNTGFEDGNYSFVAGHVDPGESASAAVVREAKEEAGITLRPDQLEFVQVVHRNSQDASVYFDVYFRATEWDGEIQNVEPHKCDDLCWFPINSLPVNTIAYIRQVIDNIYTNNQVYFEHNWGDAADQQIAPPTERTTTKELSLE